MRKMISTHSPFVVIPPGVDVAAILPLLNVLKKKLTSFPKKTVSFRHSRPTKKAPVRKNEKFTYANGELVALDVNLAAIGVDGVVIIADR